MNQLALNYLDILSKIDSNFGGVEGIEIDYPSQLNDELVQDKIKHLCTRVAVAMSELFSDPKLDISEGGAQRFFTLQRWINMIFASSPFVNARIMCCKLITTIQIKPIYPISI